MTVPTSKVVPCPTGFTDHIFKQEHGVDVPLRIWPAPKSAEGKRPWLIWLHGGGWTAGKHVIPNAWVLTAFEQLGYHVASIGYRFIPEVSIPDCAKDCEDAYHWCIKNLPSIVGEDRIDVSWCVVGGDSAGGHLSTYAGATWNPPPKVVIDVFGVIDFLHIKNIHPAEDEDIPKENGDAPKANGDAPKANGDAPKPKTHLPRDPAEVERRLANRDPSQAEVIAPWDWELPPEMDTETLRLFWGMPDFTPGDKDLWRMDMMKFAGMRLFTIGFRWDTPEEKAKMTHEEFKDVMRQYSPYHLVAKSKTYPPTFFLHGTTDGAVDIEQSYKFAKQLRGFSVPTGEAYCPGGEHCFDNQIHGPGYDGWDEYIVPCMAFVDKHIKGN